MKRLWLGIALWAGLAGHSVAAADVVAPAERLQAESVVTAYLGALVRGDVGAIRPLLGGMYLRKKAMLLDSPGYAARLAGLYAGADYAITQVEGLAGGKLAVDARLDMDTGSTLSTRFIVDGSPDPATGQIHYLIVNEIN